MLRLILVPTQYATVGSEFTCKWYCFHLKPVSYHFEPPVFKSIMWSPCVCLIFFSSLLLHHFIYFMSFIDTYEIRSPLVIGALIYSASSNIRHFISFLFSITRISSYQVNGKVVFFTEHASSSSQTRIWSKSFVSIYIVCANCWPFISMEWVDETHALRARYVAPTSVPHCHTWIHLLVASTKLLMYRIPHNIFGRIRWRC